ncbi:MAG: glycogen-binding domain-containing protein [Elusimicrobiaceae bacterium]|nr:glycogen-binding domain-containing protein [Elusimicrobiaceae bacterium]MBQ6224053.1 glycogen-binding domain-containing protein [Campylobacter sp.]
MKCKGINFFSLFFYTGALVIFIFAGLNACADFFDFTSKVNPPFLAKSETQKLLESKPKQEIPFKKVNFNFSAEEASEVLLCADFTAWHKNPLVLEKTSEGFFSKTLFLPKGEYKYYFLVDGKAKKDDSAPAVNLDLKDCPLPEISLKNVL